MWQRRRSQQSWSHTICAVEYGDRLIMMHQGRAIIDKAGADKKAMQVDDILGTFNEISIECGN